MNIEVPFNQVRKIEFGSLGPALECAKKHGGWIQADAGAIPSANTRVVWYNAERCLLSEILNDPTFNFTHSFTGLHSQWRELAAENEQEAKERDDAEEESN